MFGMVQGLQDLGCVYGLREAVDDIVQAVTLGAHDLGQAAGRIHTVVEAKPALFEEYMPAHFTG